MFCSLSYFVVVVADEIATDCFKGEITPSFKANYRLKFAQNVAMNHVKEKRKPQYKIS